MLPPHRVPREICAASCPIPRLRKGILEAKAGASEGWNWPSYTGRLEHDPEKWVPVFGIMLCAMASSPFAFTMERSLRDGPLGGAHQDENLAMSACCSGPVASV